MIIEVYPHCGTWAFTDTARGLVHEPFVCGIPEIIDHFIQHFGDTSRKKHVLTFSDRTFPSSQGALIKGAPYSGGAWYSYKDMEGWLCPATLKFFNEMPETLFVSVD